jgi:hypothetical protein
VSVSNAVSAHARIECIKELLEKTSGGYTHLNQRSEGAWQMGGATLRDEVTIVRVLDDGSAKFDWPGQRARAPS